MKRNVSAVCLFHCNILIGFRITKEMPGLVSSGTPCTRLGVYTVIIIGWSSNSGYYLLGGLHALAQTISHEVRFFFILLSFLYEFFI